ncbi:MAG: acyloxyacyl hydrolase [Bacteroidales bacterium]|nr:acyloxyacyl hydrolase [Bacteroidales bacterium]
MFLILSCLVASAGDSIQIKTPQFITVNTNEGVVFPTNDFVAGEYKIPHYSSYSIKYGFSARGDDWEDYAYGMPYMGLSLYFANFYREKDLGRPFSLYLFQGAQLYTLKPKLTLHYEWNLGSSFNWKYYDPFDNPRNVAVGSSVNIHVGANLYLKWKLYKSFDLHLGAGVTHFSNGASTLPNKGLNMASMFVELVYNFNTNEETPRLKGKITPPSYKKHKVHDLMFLISSRHAKVDTLGTGLASEFTQRKFKVLGVSYSYMFSNSYRYKWGLGVDGIYDESSGMTSWRERHPESGQTFDRVKLGDFPDRFSLGLSVKGEMMMPAYSVFANLGYDIIHGNKRDKRFYQILGVKVYLRNNLFATFGIRATNFGKAQFLYWNLGYTFKQ